jgi:hypothetical protein
MSLFRYMPPYRTVNNATALGLSLGNYVEPLDHHKNFAFAR